MQIEDWLLGGAIPKTKLTPKKDTGMYLNTKDIPGAQPRS